MEKTNHYDVIIIGAGAAGLMCAQVAGKRQRRVLVLDASEKIAEKIRISGGGRCNFTNIHATPDNYLSHNPHFCKSALAQYTQHDFIHMVEKHGIAYHEKTLGQLFCDGSSKQIIDMLLDECKRGKVDIRMSERVINVKRIEEGFSVRLEQGDYSCTKLVIATGGLSIPKIGATDFGYRIAKQFNLPIIEPRAGLVPLTFDEAVLSLIRPLAGIAVDALVSCGKIAFREGLLFTHRGLSGPSILQISSYWHDGEALTVNWAPDTDVFQWLTDRRSATPRQDIVTVLSEILPKRLVLALLERTGIAGTLADLSNAKFEELERVINRWQVTPNGTEGYKTAEVTLGGVDTNALSSKNMECRTVQGLYFIGEVVDVTGHLGGFNFQWAWSSGYACGMAV